ncbi:U3 snoRNP protein [Homalodisca vitripennis]|nr:U3 snoRNP protein [Homalodisca vitripennis]
MYFQPFSERISNVDIDVFHRVGHLNENEEEDSLTFFYKTLQKYNDLNLSKSYERLKKNIGYDVQTLPQLLVGLQKRRLVDVLSQCLGEVDSLSLQPCLELVVALAQDLRQEFYPFYPELLAKILNLLHTKDADQLEWAFTCLAYLFKYLWRFLVRDLGDVFEQLLPLLSSSRPQYVNNFAAESFAFVARKVKDKRNFLKLILKNLKRTKDGVSGCGKLLSEVVCGVQGQFHTCAETWLQFLFESLSDQGLPNGLLLEVLVHTVTSIASTISAKHSKLFWDILQELLTKQAAVWKDKKTECNSNSIAHILQLILTVLNHKQCSLLVNPVEFVKTLVNLTGNWPSEVTMLLVDISSAILLSPRVRLPQDLTIVLTKKILSSGDWNAVKHFVSRTLPYSGFEMHILPSFLQQCEDEDFKDVLLQLTKVIVFKVPPAKSFSELKNKAIYPLHSSLQWKENIIEQLLQLLDRKTIEEIERNKEDIIQALIILPNLVLKNSKNALQIEMLTSQLVNVVIQQCSDDKGSLPSMLLLLSQAMSAIFLVCDKSEYENIEFENIVSALLPLMRTHVLALQTLEILVNIATTEVLKDISATLMDELVDNLASPFRQIRLLSASILQSLQTDAGEDLYNMLSIIVSAEGIGATVHEYRDKLRQLQMLECPDNPERQSHFKVALNYLLGNLYVNFKLLWEPVSKLVVTYAKHMPAAQFWPVFVSRLNLVVQQIQLGVSTGDSHNYICEVLVEASQNLTKVEDRPDVFNHRLLLWRLMTNFPEVCEEKNRDIVVLFLDFLKSEYYRISPDEMTTWNIKQGNRKENTQVTDNIDSSDQYNNEEKMDIENDNEDPDETQDSDTEEPTNENFVPGRSASK